MKDKIIGALNRVIYLSTLAIPFFMGIAPAPMNVFMGLLIFSFILKKIIKRERLFVSTSLNLPLLAFFGITVISLAHSVDIKDTLRGGVFRLLQYILVLFIVAQEIKNKRQILGIIFSVISGLLLVSIDSFWQVASGKDFVRGYIPVFNIGLTRATASFKDSNTLGVYLSALAPLIFGLALFYFKGARKIAVLAVSLLALGAIMLTYSRPTLLAIYVVLWFFAVARRSRCLIIFLIILTVLSPFLLPRSVKEWAREVEYNPLRFMCNDDRIAFYQHSLNMIRAHPLVGVGANTYMKNYKNYKNFPEYRNVVTIDNVYAHNIYLHTAAETGLIGLGIFIWFLVKVFSEAKAIQMRMQDGLFKTLSLSLTACLIAFLVNGLTESSLYYSRVAPIFWYLVGLLFALKNLAYADR